MSVRTDTVNLNVNVNGNKAQAELNNLKKKAADIRFEMQGLKKGTDEYIAKAKELAGVTGEMTKLKKEIGITALSQRELVKELQTLKALRGSVQPFSQEFKDLTKQIKTVEDRLYNVKNGVQGFASFFSKISTEVKQFGTVVAGYLGFQFLSSQIGNIIQGAGKLSDQLADIRKAAGLSSEEVKVLNSELLKIDTRTSADQLREIAKVGGQLGIAKEDLLGFTTAVDKLNVALGDEFSGGAEEITTVVGKLRNTFSDIRSDKVDDDLLRIGNALNELGAAGIATAPVVSDFAQRIGSAGQVYGLTAGQTFGLSAALQELGITAERGSTAVVKLLQKISSSPELFLDIVKSVDPSIKSLADFKNLINTDISKAFTLVAQGFAASKGNATGFAEKLADAEIGSAAISEVLSKVGQNSQLVADKINLATGALKDQSSIQEEFNIKNETLGATLNKIGKEISEVFESSALRSFFQSAAEGVITLLKFLKDLPQFIAENRTAIILLTGAIAVYTAVTTRAGQAVLLKRAAVLLSAAADRIATIAKVIASAATAAYGVVTDLLTGKIKIATVVQRIWNTVIAANPLGALIALVTIAAAAISAFSSKTKELTAAQKLNAEVSKRVVDSTTEEISKINVLTNVVKDNSVSLDNRKKALAQLIAINPQYLNGLTLENIKTAEGKKIIDDYVASLRQKAEIEAKNSLLTDKLKARDNAFSIIRSKDIGQTKNLSDEDLEKRIKSIANNELVGSIKVGDSGMDFAGLINTMNQIKILQDDVTKAAKKNIESVVTGASTVTQTAASNTVGALKAQITSLDEAYEKIDITNKDALKKNRDDRKKLQTQVDSLEGKKSSGEKKEESDYSRLKKEADQFYKDLQKLKDTAASKSQSEQDREVLAVQQKYQELTEKALEYYKKHITNQQQFNDQSAIIEKARQDELDAIFKKFFKQRQEVEGQKEYEESLAANQDFYDKRKVQLAQDFANNKLTQDQYNDALKKIDRDSLTDRITISNDYSQNVKKAAEDVKAFKKQKEEQTTKDLVDETEKRKQLTDDEKLAKAQRGVLTSRPGSDARVQAQKDELQLRFDLETQYMDKKSEMFKLKEQQLADALKEIDRQAMLAKIDNVMQYVGYFQQALDSLNQFVANRETRQLQREKKKSDQDKKNLKQQLDNKLISQAQYDLKSQRQDEERTARENAVKRQAAKREKALNLFNAIVSNAAAILKTMAAVPFPANIPLAIAQGVAGGLQIAAIANAPLPELGTGDWIRKGDKHKDKSGGIPALIERDEAVMNAASMNDNEVLTVTGTTAQITSALNSRKGNGVSWAGGAIVEMPKWRTETPASINPTLPKIMEQGGIVRDLPGTTKSGAGNSDVLLQTLIDKTQENTDAITNMKTKLHAVVSIKEYREEEARYDAAKKVSGIKQS
jgi:TP901 family phage tail tape measure protein